ncbi:MAG: hypothetical protein JNJ83_07120 [Verrucomicrobiaceae bacterium]|nr:hypothetical protein [Verrucomicrobiaceae bacterium]
MTERSLFPSAIISTATVDWNGDEQTAEDKKTADDPKLKKGETPIYGDENGWLAVQLLDVTKGAEVEVEIAVDGIMKPSKWTGVITKAAPEVLIFPKAKWDYAALHTVRQQRPVNATFKVTVDGEALEEQTEVCVLKSINDCPFAIVWDKEEGDVEDISAIFAAYVNENHPWVDELLKDALQSKLVSSFSGYQSQNPEDVVTQVFAIWNILQRRGIKYSDISTTTPDALVYSQTVRFVDDSIKGSQANCVDGSVLLASVLQKIGIKSHLVIVPGHCFLAFETVPIDWNQDFSLEELLKEGALIPLETTLLGSDDLKPVTDLAKMPDKAKLKEFEASYTTFGNAISTGIDNMVEHLEALESGDEIMTNLISIADARELGIMPLASTMDKK